jgi:hypothetical protein
MTTTDFSLPSSSAGDRVDLKELNGALLFIEVKELHLGIATAFGPSDAVTCNVAVLDGAKKGETFQDTMLFPKILVSQLKPSIGAAPVLARLGQGTAKPGQSAPWVLTGPTEAEIQTGRKYLAYRATQAPISTPADTSSPF